MALPPVAACAVRACRCGPRVPTAPPVPPCPRRCSRPGTAAVRAHPRNWHWPCASGLNRSARCPPEAWHRPRGSDMSDALDSLNGLIIPLAEQPLLLPNVAVAELVGYRLGQAASQGPAWFPGWANWRDQRVPLVDPGVLL